MSCGKYYMFKSVTKKNTLSLKLGWAVVVFLFFTFYFIFELKFQKRDPPKLPGDDIFLNII